MGKMSKNIFNMKGIRFGKLLVGDFSHLNKHRQSCWHVKCDCGTEKVSSGTYLKRSGTTSCGCAKRKRGMASKTTYSAWYEMRKRCLNPNHENYKYYGGMGITICYRWLEFDNFYEDMGERPEGMTIDRHDISKDYSKENCHWATRYINNNYMRPDVWFIHNGKTMVIEKKEGE